MRTKLGAVEATGRGREGGLWWLAVVSFTHPIPLLLQGRVSQGRGQHGIFSSEPPEVRGQGRPQLRL